MGVVMLLSMFGHFVVFILLMENRPTLNALLFSPAECRRRLELRLAKLHKEIEHLEERIAEYRKAEAGKA